MGSVTWGDMNATEIAEIQAKYRYLTNYVGEDPTAPIDPLSYVDSGGDRLLHIAAFRGDARTIGLLLDSGQTVDELGEMGLTALHYAYWSGHRDTVELLLSRKADADIRDAFGRLPHDLSR